MDIRFDLRWCCGSDEEVSPELFRLLQAIDRSGSLRAAASDCRVSYRHAWGVLQKWEQKLAHPLVNLERGRGAGLTELGKLFLWEQKRIHARLEPELASLASELSSAANALLKAKEQSILHVFASHGLGVAMLRDMALTSGLLTLDLQFRGSLDSVRLLKNGRCDLAGFHLPEGRLGGRLLRRFRPFLNPRTDTLIYALRRRQGIMTAPGNPFKIGSLTDLTIKSVRFINRQRNSGTRITLDLLLEEARIDPERINGYESEEFTHMAIAALVASGAADCAFGIEAAANRFGLTFIPCNWENYWFAVAKEKLDTPLLSNFLALLRSAEFHQNIAGLPGYEAARAGEVVTLDAELKALLSSSTGTG